MARFWKASIPLARFLRGNAQPWWCPHRHRGVSLGNPLTKQPPKGGGPALRIPSRYGDPKQSDLHYEVQSGSQTYNIELK